MPEAAAIYCRISDDREGHRLGVERQEQLCRQLADRLGWEVAEVYVDNDISAYTGAPRPEYERMLSDIEDSLRDAVIVVDQDRLVRQTKELERFIDVANAHEVALANVSGDVDLSSSDGRFRARMMGVVAQHESEKKSERIRRERAQRAEKGRPHPGPRAFGFREGNIEHHPAEADLLRRAARDVLGGRSMRSIAEEWNRQGVTTARGNDWSVSAVNDVLTRVSNAGLRKHRGEIVGEGVWDPILERDVWERLVAQAEARKRPAGRPPTRMLSGILQCAHCEGPMRSSTSYGTPIYACSAVPSQPDSCGRLSIKADETDAWVSDLIVDRIDVHGLAEAMLSQFADDDRSELGDQLRADEQAMQQLARDFYADRVIGRAEFLAAREQLEGRIEKTTRRLREVASVPTLGGLPSDGDVAGWWKASHVDAQRSWIEFLTDRVTCLPKPPSKPREYDPARIEVVWQR